MRLFLLSVAFCSVLLVTARAERFLTPEQARKIYFPTATEFEEEVFEATALQAQRIEEKTSSKLSTRKVRYYIARKEKEILGVLFFDQAFGKHEFIDYAVAVSPNGGVLGVEILEYRESHGYEIRKAAWRNQFKGKTAMAPLRLNKDIYNLSGATISCRAITNGTKRLLQIFSSYVAPKLGSPEPQLVR